jgi:hypothetical protein
MAVNITIAVGLKVVVGLAISIGVSAPERYRTWSESQGRSIGAS